MQDLSKKWRPFCQSWIFWGSNTNGDCRKHTEDHRRPIWHRSRMQRLIGICCISFHCEQTRNAVNSQTNSVLHILDFENPSWILHHSAYQIVFFVSFLVLALKDVFPGVDLPTTSNQMLQDSNITEVQSNNTYSKVKLWRPAGHVRCCQNLC